MKNNLDSALDHANRVILNDLNINLNIVEENLMTAPNGTKEFKIVLPISTQLVGPLAPMFKSIDLEIRLFIFENMNFRLVYAYSYKHPSGSNGHTVKNDYVQAMFGEYQVKN